MAGMNNTAKRDNSGRNRLLWAGAAGLATFAVAVTAQGVLGGLGLIGDLGGWGVWVIAPAIGAAMTTRMTLAWLRCRAASKALQKERDLLMSHVRELTYNINNPLNSITANLVALKSEFNPGSVQQIETSSRMIAKIVSKLANIDLAALLQAEQVAGGGVNVEAIGRSGSL
jgi:hypothetical protein